MGFNIAGKSESTSPEATRVSAVVSSKGYQSQLTGGHGPNHAVDNGLLYLAVFSYVTLATLFCMSSPRTIQLLAAYFGLVVTIVLLCRTPVKALYLLVLVTHLGPIVTYQIPTFGALNLGDMLILAFAIRALYVVITRTVLFPPLQILIPAMCGLMLASYVFAPEHRKALAGLFGTIEILIVFVCTLEIIKTRQEAHALMGMVGFAVLISATVHIYWYTKGVSLLLSDDTIIDFLKTGELVARPAVTHSSDQYGKNSFFYGSFIASCTVALTVASFALFLSAKRRLLSSIYWVFVLAVTVISSLISGSRTQLYASGAVSVVIIIWGMRRRFGRSLVALLLLGGAGWSVLAIHLSIVGEDQRSAFVRMFFDDAHDSMQTRVDMWLDITRRAYEFPKEFLIGIGPDLPSKAPEVPQVARLMTGYAVNMQLSSFHNFYIDIIFQEGVFFFIVFMMFIAYPLIGTFRLWSDGGDYIGGMCFCALSSWLLMWMSHATGWSKPVLIFAELVAIGYLVGYGRLMDSSGRGSAGVQAARMGRLTEGA